MRKILQIKPKQRNFLLTIFLEFFGMQIRANLRVAEETGFFLKRKYTYSSLNKKKKKKIGNSMSFSNACKSFPLCLSVSYPVKEQLNPRCELLLYKSERQAAPPLYRLSYLLLLSFGCSSALRNQFYCHKRCAAAFEYRTDKPKIISSTSNAV